MNKKSEYSKIDRDSDLLREMMRQQPVIAPRPQLRARILAGIKSEPQNRFSYKLGYIGLLLVLVLVFWGVVKPGTVIQWELRKGNWETVQIYRSDGGGKEFVLLDEMVISQDSNRFVYRDYRVVPVKAYLYQVRAEGNHGSSAQSQIVAPNVSVVWLMWLAVIIPALIVGGGIIYVINTQLWLRLTIFETASIR